MGCGESESEVICSGEGSCPAGARLCAAAAAASAAVRAAADMVAEEVDASDPRCDSAEAATI